MCSGLDSLACCSVFSSSRKPLDGLWGNLSGTLCSGTPARNVVTGVARSRSTALAISP